jgi:hypothetical protein
MATGPKWICHISSADSAEFSGLTSEQILQAKELLMRLKPLGIKLTSCLLEGDSIIATSKADQLDQIRSYAFVDSALGIEMAGVVPTGYWGPGSVVWWPGSYEIPLLSQVESTVIPLLDVLKLNRNPILRMELVGLQGYSLIAKSGTGSERPYSLPADVNDFHFPPVRLDGFTDRSKEMMISVFDQIRVCANVEPPGQFYL